MSTCDDALTKVRIRVDETNTIDANETAEAVQGHLIEVLTVNDGVEPIYRTILGFCDSTSTHETSAPAMHTEP
jgi:hypothetical protein